MSKPSILVIPGSFSLPKFYDTVMDPVAAQGYEIRGLHLPSVGLSADAGRPGAPATMYDDAAFIAAEANKLADEGKDVILVPHSYAGVPTSESLKGLSKEERQKAGKKGGVVRIAYMTAVVPPVGMAAMGMLADIPKELQIELAVDVRPLTSSFPSYS
jgi:alpha-beta hydrolase superfamily lysophospholipase